LIAFNRQQIISSGALDDQARGLQLRMQRIEHRHLTVQLPVVQQTLRHWNLVGLFVHRFQAQGAAALQIHGPQQMLASVANGFAIDAQ
jgi:hypothetical protein